MCTYSGLIKVDRGAAIGEDFGLFFSLHIASCLYFSHLEDEDEDERDSRG